MRRVNGFDKLEITSKLISLRLNGQRTTVRLFASEIDALDRICSAQDLSLDEFCAGAARDPKRVEHSLTAKIRGAMVSYLLEQWQAP